MKLHCAVEIYIGQKQASGLSFKGLGKILRRFAKFTGNIQLAKIADATANAFLDHYSPSNNAWITYSSCLRRFFIYWYARRQLRALPEPKRKPYLATGFFPYIYTRAEIKKLLACANKCQLGWKCSVDSSTLQVFLLFLFSTGINIEDALRLSIGDVQLGRKIVSIEKASTSRARKIAIGDDLKELLHSHLDWRSESATSEKLFCTIQRKQIPYAVVRTAFSRLRKLAGVKRVDSTFQPRLIDLRHSFVVHALTRLARRGYKKEKALPMVAAYVGSTDQMSFSRYAGLVPQTFTKQLRKLQ